MIPLLIKERTLVDEVNTLLFSKTYSMSILGKHKMTNRGAEEKKENLTKHPRQGWMILLLALNENVLGQSLKVQYISALSISLIFVASQIACLLFQCIVLENVKLTNKCSFCCQMQRPMGFSEPNIQREGRWGLTYIKLDWWMPVSSSF